MDIQTILKIGKFSDDKIKENLINIAKIKI